MAGTIEDNISKIETQSTTHLEEDEGSGSPVIIRAFEYAANPEAFKQHVPTKQELFNYHHKQIEIALWADGFTVLDSINPKVMISRNKKKYRILVGAKPMKGRLVYTQPQTLSQIVHNEPRH